MHENVYFFAALAFLLGAEHIVGTVERLVTSALQSAARIRDEYGRLFPGKKPPPTSNSTEGAVASDCRGKIST